MTSSNQERGPDIHHHTNVTLGSSKGWNVLVTFMLVAGIVVIGYQLSLGPWAELTATGISMFAITMITMSFKAGILKMPEVDANDDLAFTKSTLRRIYEELQQAIVNSSLLRIFFFALGYTLGFLLLRAAVGAGLSVLDSMWIAVGVGLLAGAAVVAQDKIFAAMRKMRTKKGQRAN